MKTRSLTAFLTLLTALTNAAAADPLNVVIVTRDGAESERGYTEFLQETYRGNVSVHIDPNRYEEDLSDARKIELESADLIIVSRDNGSKDYNADAEFWNLLNVPILNHNARLARSNGHKYWDWLDGDDMETDPFTGVAVADPNDPIFAGVDTSSGVIEMLTIANDIDHSDQPSAGSGTVVATAGGNVFIARWRGDEASYYPASDYAPGGPRIFFAMPNITAEFFDDATDQAKLMLRNAILSLLPIYSPLGDLDGDQDVDFGDLAIFAWYYGDSACTEPSPCARADFTGDANITADDFGVFGANWLAGVDFTAPEPNVMTWQTEPMTTSTTSIYMAATPASDVDNGIEYYFQCTSANGPDSGWQYANTFEPNSLTTGMKYTYRTKARDTSSRLNETEWSDPATARTFEIYRHIADASAGAAIDANLFIVAGDEINTLAVYDKTAPGSIPVTEADLTSYLNIESSHPETDIEGATWFNDRIFWMTSHGRNRDGRYGFSRYQFFATSVTTVDGEKHVAVDGNYTQLIDDLIAYDAIYDLGLAHSIGVHSGHIDANKIARLAPKVEGLNIEGLCAASDANSMFIAFRNPRPVIDGNEMALIIELSNPEEVVLDAAPADLGPPTLLDLGGLGIRSMEYSPTLGRYLIIAGSHLSGIEEPLQILYAYDMSTGLLTVIDDFPVITPEAMFQFPGSTGIQLLSDDGILLIDTPEGPTQNKLLPREQRTFRTQVITP